MAQHKKPSPGNKHETRLVAEARPAGIAPSTFRTEDGSSVDMVSVVGETPRVVRVAQAAYDGLVRDGTQLYSHDFMRAVFNSPPVAPALYTVTVVGQVRVPAGMVFDLTSTTFVVNVPLAGGGPFGPFHTVGDWETEAYYGYRIHIDGVSPWDSYIESVAPAAVLDWKFPTNKDYLDLGGDCPTHIIAAEGQLMTFEVIQWSAADPTAILPGGGIHILVRGRWIPVQHYKRIIGANALE